MGTILDRLLMHEEYHQFCWVGSNKWHRLVRVGSQELEPVWRVGDFAEYCIISHQVMKTHRLK